MDFGVRYVNVSDTQLRVNFFDLAGATEYQGIRYDFLTQPHANAVLLVFDVTSRASFEALPLYIQETQAANKSAVYTLIIAGNKVDGDAGKRVVEQVEAEQFAAKHNAVYYDCSASTGLNVDELFNYMFQDVVRKIKRQISNEAG